MKEYFKIALAWCLAFSAVVWASGTALFVFGPRAETTVLPVVDSVKATLVQMDQAHEIMHIAAYGKKVRQCEWKAITAMVQKNGMWHQGTVYFTDPRKNSKSQTKFPVSRPIGSQSLGEIFVFPTGERCRSTCGTTVTRCGRR